MAGIDQITPIANMADYSSTYLPTASSSGTGFINDVAKVVSNVGEKMSNVSLELPNSFASLLEAQIKAQEEMQSVSMVSNIEKSKHETSMAAIRNIKIS